MEMPDQIAGHQILGILGQGACGVVYRARCPKSGEMLALKHLYPAEEGTVIDQLRFEREFRLASTCDHPFLVKTFTYGVHEDRPFYTMQLVEGVTFSERFAQLREGKEVAVFARVVNGIWDALAEIHQKGIVHRDLKPENVLVDSNNQPRILDFGLAKPQYEDEGPKLTTPGSVLGTVHYLSPEQLSSRPIDCRSDLFSIGGMLYEALSGRLPFDSQHPLGVLSQILTQAPPSLNLGDAFPEGLEPLVFKLLAKEPADRYQSAQEVAAEWAPLMLGKEEPGPRRSLRSEQLYQPRFSGQKAARDAFEALKRQSNSPLLLVAGETGCGKSRFLEECGIKAQSELRAHSLGKAGEADPLPYQLWLEPLRQAFKRPSAATKALRPVLAPLLQEQGDTPARASTKSQLFDAMARVLQASYKGGMIWLDDLHLSDAASLEFLHYLARGVDASGPLLVATYHPGRAEGFLLKAKEALLVSALAKETCLVPLNQEETRDLVGSMLGGHLSDASAALVHRETGGNPFFTCEIVKAAVTEERFEFIKGEWRLKESPGRRPLPATIREQLDRQLETLADSDWELLRMAAVLGLSFEFELLVKASDIPKAELLDRLLKLAAKGLLVETPKGDFAFRSRALQQVVLESVPQPELARVHESVAEVLEKMGPRQGWMAELARHYESAGKPEKAVTHLLVAGAEALRNFAFEDALDFYRRIMKVPKTKRAISNDVLLEKEADARVGLSQFEEASRLYQDLLSRARATVTQVRLRRKIAECQQMLGDFRAAYEHLGEGLDLLGVAPAKPGSLRHKATNTLSWIQEHFPKLAGKFKSDEVMSEQIHRILDRQLSTLFFLRPPGWTTELSELARLQANVSQKLQNPEAGAQAQIFLGFVDLHQGQPDSALENWRQAIAIARGLRDSPYKSLVLRNLALMHLMAGTPEPARELCHSALQICERLSDRPGVTQTQMVLCGIELHRAHFAQALDHARVMLSTADELGLPVFQALGWSYLARAEARNELLPEAQEHLLLAMELSSQLRLPYVDMLVALARSWVNCHLGNFQLSLDSVEEGLALCDQIEALPFYRLTLRCAAIYARLEWLKAGQSTEQIRAALNTDLSSFQADSERFSIEQFVRVADQLKAEIATV